MVGCGWPGGCPVGAEVAAHQPQPTMRVLLGPAGQPFCLWLGE